MKADKERDQRTEVLNMQGSGVLNYRSLGGGDFEDCGASRVFFYSISSTDTDYVVQVIA